jgi:hypothetical protein
MAGSKIFYQGSLSSELPVLFFGLSSLFLSLSAQLGFSLEKFFVIG